MDSIILINILRGIAGLANFYTYLMFIFAVLNLLAMFGVINIYGEGVVARIYFILRSIIEPVTSNIKRLLPKVGVIDVGFLVLLILLWILVDICQYYIAVLKMSSFAF